VLAELTVVAITFSLISFLNFPVFYDCFHFPNPLIQLLCLYLRTITCTADSYTCSYRNCLFLCISQ
jgi:hypothetical protein